MLINKLLIFGYGYCAKALVSKFKNKKNEILVVSRNKQKIDKLNELGIKACEWTNTSVVKHYISVSNTILISVPPYNFIDPVEEKFSKFFSQANKKTRLIYLSSTGVYGDHKGAWVNENSKLKGNTKFGLGRKIVEKSWIKFRDLYNLDINILRVSGIYSKESNVLKKITKKSVYVKEKKYFSRIRIEDLAQILKKMFFSQKKFRVLNASDDKPATNKEVANFAAKLLKIKNLKPVPIAKFKNKMIKEFYKDSKKVSNKNMKNKLQIKLRFPSYKEGLKNLFN